MASEPIDSPIGGDMTTPPGKKVGPDEASTGASVTPSREVTSDREEVAERMHHAPGGNGLPSLPEMLGHEGRNQSLVAASLALRSLCPDCVHLGGCRHGIPGLIPLPDRGDIESLTKTSKSYLEKLIANGMVIGLRLLSTKAAARGETFLSGPSLCAAVKRGEIKIGETEAE